LPARIPQIAADVAEYRAQMEVHYLLILFVRRFRSEFFETAIRYSSRRAIIGSTRLARRAGR